MNQQYYRADIVLRNPSLGNCTVNKNSPYSIQSDKFPGKKPDPARASKEMMNIPKKDTPLFRQPVANQSIHPMIACTETPELHLLPILNLLRITISPLHRHVGVCIGVYQHVERTIAIELRKESHGCCDLPEYGLYLFLDLLFGLFGGQFGAPVVVVSGMSEIEVWWVGWGGYLLGRGVLFVC
jgi:hypothetical protein